MELRNIKSFIKVSELLSFTKAATELGYTQSNISTQIHQLETELGCRLFERIGKNVSLSAHGQNFLTHAIIIENNINHAKLSLSIDNFEYAEIRIGVLESLCITYMPNIVNSFHKTYPNIKIIIKIATYEELSEMLNTNKIDLLWIFDYPLSNNLWIKAYDHPIPIHLISSATHPLASKKICDVSNLHHSNFIFTENSCSYRIYFENMLCLNKITYNTFIEIGNTEIIKNFVASGLCLSFLPQFSIQNELNEGKLNIISLHDFSFQMYSQLFYHKNKLITNSIHFIIDLLSQSFKDVV